MAENLYFVRTPEIMLSELHRVVEQLKEREIEVVNAYFIQGGIPTQDFSIRELDGVELVLKTDVYPTEIEEKLEGIIPRNSQIYMGTDLLARVPV